MSDLDRVGGGPAPAHEGDELLVRVALGVVGCALCAFGVIGVFVSDNGPGTAGLVVAGGVLLVLSLVWDRIAILRFGEDEIRMRKATDLLARSELAAARGDDEAAEELRAVALGLLEQAGSGAGQEAIHAGSAGRPRTEMMSPQMEQARALARRLPPTRQEVEHLLRGSDGDRITGLGFIQVAPEAGDVHLICGVVADSRSAYEQWEALQAARRMVSVLDHTGLAVLDEGLRHAESVSPYLAAGSDRAHLLGVVRAAIDARLSRGPA
jgi:hypothetical protein